MSGPAARARPQIGFASATALVALSACCFGAIAIFVTLATRAGAPLLSILAWRYLLGAALLFVIAGGPRVLGAARGRIARLVLLGGLGQALIAFGSLSALRFIPVATLVFLFYTYPSWIAVIGAMRGTERVDAMKVLALLLSLAGIALMVGAPARGALHPIGVGLALGAALLYALYVPFLGQLREGISARLTSALVTGGAGIFFVATGLLMRLLGREGSSFDLVLALAPRAWYAIAALVIVSTVVAFVAFLTGLAVLGPVRTAIVSTVEPFFATVLGALVLGQPLGWSTLAGGAAIAAAVMLLQLARRSDQGGSIVEVGPE